MTAYDAYGNEATGYTGIVAITSSDSQAVLPEMLASLMVSALSLLLWKLRVLSQLRPWTR